MVFSYPAQIRASSANSGPRGGLGDVVPEGVPAPPVGVLAGLGSDHFGSDFAVVSAGGFGVAGDGVDGEVLPALRRGLRDNSVLTHARRTFVTSLHFATMDVGLELAGRRGLPSQWIPADYVNLCWPREDGYFWPQSAGSFVGLRGRDGCESWFQTLIEDSRRSRTGSHLIPGAKEFRS
jgi:hypothetical protein